MKNIRIRTSVLINMTLITIIVISSITVIQRYYGQKVAFSAADERFSNIADQVSTNMKGIDLRISDFLDYITMSDDVAEIVAFDRLNKVSYPFRQLMLNMPSIYAGYVGYPDGSFFELVNLEVTENTRRKLDAPDNARWAVIKFLAISEGREERREFLDKDFNVISFTNKGSDYDPRTRPWYKKAVKAGGVEKTDPYVFSHLQEAGVTYAKESDRGVVVAVDISLETLSDVLHRQKITDDTQVFLFDDSKMVIASSEKNFDTDCLNSIYRKSRTGIRTPEKVNLKSEDYILTYAELARGEFLGICIPYNFVIKDYAAMIDISLYVTLACVILLSPLVLYVIDRTVRPIKRLMVQSELVAQRRFNEVYHYDSFIREFHELSLSMYNMSRDIHGFQLSQQELFDSFIKLIAEAIDKKSTHTGGHCRRVPEIAMMLSRAASGSDDGVFADFAIKNSDEEVELNTAGWLHDCGKLTTPEFVVDKSTKLETMYNRINEIRTRFEVVLRDYQIEALKREIAGEPVGDIQSWLKEREEKLFADFEFVASVNTGAEFTSDADIERVRKISETEWTRHFNNRLGLSNDELKRFSVEEVKLPVKERLISDKPEHIVERNLEDSEYYSSSKFNMKVPNHLYNRGELYNLSINKGTLTEEERFKIKEHAIMSIRMLDQLPFPEHMKRVPEYATMHHEAMDGKGYPLGSEMSRYSIPARIMAVADIFEALTAPDRPYKDGKTLSESLRIMHFMAKDKEIDKDIFNLMLTSRVYLKYAEKFMNRSQIDEVDVEDFLI